MRFRLMLLSNEKNVRLPINYQYPLSSAIYRVMAKGDKEYTDFLHEKGYGKGFKFFTFSQINCPFKIEGDRLHLLSEEVEVHLSFHLPKAMESFVKGLFHSEQIDIADKKSRGRFSVKSIEAIANPLSEYKENEVLNIQLKPLSPVVAGLMNEKGNYDFLSPEDSRFVESIVYNWRNKIAACYDETIAGTALLLAEVIMMKQPPKSRLLTIKDGQASETKIRGWMNFGLKVTTEKRFVELLMNAGVGVYNSMGSGCVEVVIKKMQKLI